MRTAQATKPLLAALALVLATTWTSAAPTALATRGPSVPICSSGGGDIVVDGSVTTADAKTYQYVPFSVAAGITRVEVGYSYGDTAPAPPSTPITQSVIDLGLWDADGLSGPDGFRGWSGSRQGKVADGQDPVFVQADTAERGYVPGEIEPGVWNVELGIAAVAPGGADWQVTIRCLDPTTGTTPVARPVDATHVANPSPGWYHGDFHMHSVHSNPNAPDLDGFVQFARDAELDFLPVTEYVTTRHHDELGPTQVANPDLVIWPGREIITYFGHANAIGETPSVIDYRHGYRDVTLGDIQAATKADGALFQVNHPTIFPGPVFANFCRGCEFTLGDDIDWRLVDTIEVVTGPVLVDDSDIGGPGASPIQIEQPFVMTAIDLWEAKLLEGFRITAVSGSDDKLGPGLGSSATAVFAENLSRPALIEGIEAGRAYVRTRGVAASPALELTAVGDDGQTGMIGDTFVADSAEVTVRLTGADGQVLRIIRNGDPVSVVPVTGDDFTHTFMATRGLTSGPLGTFWRVDVLDDQSLTVISNPIFLGTVDEPAGPDGGADDGVSSNPPADDGAGAPGGDTLPATGGSLPVVALSVVVVAALAALAARRSVVRA